MKLFLNDEPYLIIYAPWAQNAVQLALHTRISPVTYTPAVQGLLFPYPVSPPPPEKRTAGTSKCQLGRAHLVSFPQSPMARV